MRRPAPRQLALFTVLGLSLAATAWVSRDDTPEPVSAVSRRTSAMATTAAVQPGWPASAAGTRADWPALDAQVQAAWGQAPLPPAAAPTPAPPPAEEIPPLPAAPPFPYRFVGRLNDGAARAILDSDQRSTVVGAGDVVDGEWRVDAVEPAGLRLTYLPLGLPRFVPFATPAA